MFQCCCVFLCNGVYYSFIIASYICVAPQFLLLDIECFNFVVFVSEMGFIIPFGRG